MPVILRRYMMQQVAVTTAMVVGFLTVLLLGGRLIRYFGIAAEGRLDVGLLFVIIGYNLPYFLELILPLSFFIGLMLVFGRLYVDHEMAVLNSSGLSRGYLARLLLPLILALFVAEAGLSLFAKPWGVRHSENIWQQQSLNSAFDLIRPQSFISSDDYHLYVGSISEDKSELHDVVLVQTGASRMAEEGDGALGQEATPLTAMPTDSMLTDSTPTDNTTTATLKKDVLVLAKRALQVPAANDSAVRQLDLYQGRRYEIDARSQVYNQVSFERYRISFNNPSNEGVSDTNMTTQSLPALWAAATGHTHPKTALASDDNSNGNGNSNGADVGDSDGNAAPQASASTQQQLPAQAELGYRFTLPWLMFIAPMLAVPLAQVPPRQGRWLRLLPAILIFASCALVLIALKNAVLNAKVSIWAYPLVIIAFLGFALYLNWASRIQHRLRFRLGKLATTANANADDGSLGGQP